MGYLTYLSTSVAVIYMSNDMRKDKVINGGAEPLVSCK